MADNIDNKEKLLGQKRAVIDNTSSHTHKVGCKKEVIEYVVIAITEFAKRYFLTIKEASNYLLHYKGIDFLEQCYDAEHTLSVNDWIEDITAICKRNGGKIG
jgi:hypothetical protein